MVCSKLQLGFINRAWKEARWKESVLGREVALEDVKSSCDRGIGLIDPS